MRIGILSVNGKYLSLASLYIAFIYYLSSLPGSVLGKDTNVSRLISNLFHIPLFGILSLLLLFAFKGNHNSSGNLKMANILSFLLTVIYAFFDEWHQTFAKGRMFSLFDVCLDTVGCAFFLAGYTVFRHKNEICRNNAINKR